MRILCLGLHPRASHVEQSELDRNRLASELEEFSSQIGWYEWAGGYRLCLDVTGTSHWFGGETALLDRLRVWCDERRLACTATLADTLGTAWAVQWLLLDREAIFTSRVVPPSVTIDALEPLPIESLRLSKSTTALLRELGLDIVGPLFYLPRDAVAERFEPELLLRLDQAQGHAPELFDAYRPEPTIKAELAWEFGISDANTIAEVWGRMLPKLFAPLTTRGRGVARLLAELHGESGSQCRLVVGLLRPTLDRRHLFELLRLRLESVRVREPIVGTTLSVLEEASLAIQQQVLFAELSPPTESAAWSSLIERLTGRLGSDCVVRIRPHTDHDPARAWKALPWIRRSVRTKARNKAQVDVPPALPRPTLLLPQPRSIQVLALAPQGHPQRFHDQSGEARVVRSWGPERIETGWWRGPSLRRDYYRVETESGIQAWLFRDLRTRRWFLHGWFD